MKSRTRIPFRFALTTWLPGVTVRSLIGTPGIDAAYRQMGELLRRLHTIPMTAYGYIVADGIRRPQPSNDDYMRAAFDQAFRQFREQTGDEALTRRLEEKASRALTFCGTAPDRSFAMTTCSRETCWPSMTRTGACSSPA